MADQFSISLAATNKVTPPVLPSPNNLWPTQDYKIEYRVSETHNETEPTDIEFPLTDIPSNMGSPHITQFVYRVKTDPPGGDWIQAGTDTSNSPPFSLNTPGEDGVFSVHDSHGDLNTYQFLLYVDYTSGSGPSATKKTFVVDPEIHNM